MTNAIGYLIEQIIHFWITITGRKINFESDPWLESPMGDKTYIGSEFYADLALKRDLKIEKSPDAGLLKDFSVLDSVAFDSSKVNPAITHFYEHTSEYDLEAWSHSAFPSRLFLWILTTFVSRRMNQLNFPVTAMELAGGMKSEVLPMIDNQGNRKYTGWLRKLSNPEKVIYTGLYSSVKPPKCVQTCVKVSFPLPQGSSTVFLKPKAEADGSFKLISSGKGFGDSGYYRMVANSNNRVKVRYLRTLKENFHVYEDDAGLLRTDHFVKFLWMPVITLHYKIRKKD
ncbi:MAG: hypothetical protein ACI9JN_000019 [Bacteroidia bacterium]|jgi:hypothetical protein